MRSRLLSILLALPLLAVAQTVGERIRVTLASGAEHVGTVRYQNDQVLVLVDDSGQAFQYTRERILSWTPVTDGVKRGTTDQPTAVGVEIALMAGGGRHTDLDADLFIGYNDLLHRHIFLGGGLGYHMLFVTDGQWMLLPLMVRAEMPFLPERKVHPTVAMNAGYSLAIGSKDRKEQDDLQGGAMGELDLGLALPIRGGRQFSLALFGRVQGYGARSIKSGNYSYSGRGTLLTGGLRLAIRL